MYCYTIPQRLVAVSVAAALASCSSLEGTLSGDKVDYRSQSVKTAPLEVPPDLSQLSRDARYLPQQGGAVSAATYQAAASAPAAGGPVTLVGGVAVAPENIGELRVERTGDERWLVTKLTPEQLWPVVKTFWQERGFSIAYENPEAGIMETDWAENRAKIPSDFIRNTIGRVFDSLYSTGERDKFRVRIDRVVGGSEVYISHRGMVEVFNSTQRDTTIWTQRPTDPSLEADFMAKLMVKLGSREDAARTAVANAAPQPARARVLAGQPGAALQVDEAFDRAWRRVGVALDRTGFTVEDRDRAGGLYFVRYIDPNQEAKSGGFFSNLFGGGDKTPATSRYRIAVKGENESSTTVSVLSAQGTPESSEVGQRIVSLLVEDLK